MIYLNFGTEGGWIALAKDPERSISDELLAYNNMFVIPEKSKRKSLPENVNGVMTWHYVIDEYDLEELGAYEGVGDECVAFDGRYLVKLDTTISGSFIFGEVGDQITIDEGALYSVFNIHDVDEDFTIELPSDAAEAESFTFYDDSLSGGEWTREDVPLPEDAEIDFAMEGMVSAYTNLSYEEALEFMLAQLEANGWVVEGGPSETEDSYWADFVKGGETLDLMIDPAYDDTDCISIMITID